MEEYGNVCITIKDYRELVERSQKLNIIRNALAEMAGYEEESGEVFFDDLYSHLPRLLKVVDPGYYKSLKDRLKGETPCD